MHWQPRNQGLSIRPLKWPISSPFMAKKTDRRSLCFIIIDTMDIRFSISVSSFNNKSKKPRQNPNRFWWASLPLFTPYADMAVQTAEIIKNVMPGCQVVLGGHHPTELPQQALESRAVDFLIRGEGETSMVLLAEALQKGIDPRKIPGVCCRNSDRSLIITEPAVMQNLDEYPLPATNLMHAKYYMRGDRPGYTILASRGCPFNCSYCAMGRSPIGIYRQRSVDRIIAEMDHAVQLHNCGFFDFEDENLSHDKKWFTNLLKAIIHTFASSDLELRAMNGLFPPSLDENLLKLMKKAGFKTLNLSLGSTSGKSTSPIQPAGCTHVIR